MDLHIGNNLFHTVFTIINDINGDLNFLYGLELLFPSFATGTHDCDTWKKLINLTRIPRNAVSRLPALFHKIEVNL